MSCPDYKIVVLDDDPTGTQTVHGVDVYTAWTPEWLDRAFEDERGLFYVLTNSRALPPDSSRRLHEDLVESLVAASKRHSMDMDIISRSDSTLRGHYPLEMDVIRRVLASNGRQVDGEIIAPFFAEGGRITCDDIHYVIQDEKRVPVSNTEFANDRVFGYRSANLREWVAEKTDGAVPAEDVVSISIALIRGPGVDAVAEVLSTATANRRFVVNAETYSDMDVFVAALRKVRAQGKRFLYRTAASFVKAYAGIADQALLASADLQSPCCTSNGGLIIVGSHVMRTTEQLQVLLAQGPVCGVEFNVTEVINGNAQAECQRVLETVENTIRGDRHAVIYTSRQVMPSNGSCDDVFEISTRVSECLAGIVERLSARPDFVVAKGGITSSDIATKGLGICRAEVLGQILPGVPVWRQGEEAKYPGCAYVVFPGNVGDQNALLNLVKVLDGKSGNREKGKNVNVARDIPRFVEAAS